MYAPAMFVQKEKLKKQIFCNFQQNFWILFICAKINLNQNAKSQYDFYSQSIQKSMDSIFKIFYNIVYLFYY